MRPETCGRCGQEVRFGRRPSPRQRGGDDSPYWMHRDPTDDVDHIPVFGTPWSAEEAEHLAARRHEPWTYVDADGVEHTTTTAAWEHAARMKKSGVDVDHEETEVDEPEWSAPPPEITSTPIEITDERLPGGAKQIWKLAEKLGWTVVAATYSRGPRLHATQNKVLGMSDYVQLKMRLDGSDRRAVGSWFDGKFDFAYNLTLDSERRRYTTHRTNSDGLKAWIRGE